MSLVDYTMNHPTYTRGIALILVAIMVVFAGCSGDTTADADPVTTTPDNTTTTAQTEDTESTTSTTVTQTTTNQEQTTKSETKDPSSLAFGDAYTASNGMQVTVDELEFVDSYGEGWDKQESTPGKKFLFVTITAENTGDKPAYSPDDMSVVALAGNQQFNSEIYWLDDGKAYEWAELQPGIVESGILVFQVDEDLTIDDIDIVWSEQYYTFDEDAYGRWS
jgi:Domain of unknown function (DUF4352)